MVSYLWDNLFRNSNKEQQIDNILKENFIFKTLTDRELSFVRKMVHYRTYRPGEPIFKQGELGVGMYILVKGHVNITVDDHGRGPNHEKNTTVARLGSGDFFGEIALVEQVSRRTATVIAADEVSVLGFFKPDLAEILERNPQTGIKILSQLCEVLGRRLKETAERFTEIKRELKELSNQNADV